MEGELAYCRQLRRRRSGITSLRDWPGLSLGPSISVIFNRQGVARLNFVPAQECESNPLWAATLRLPARVRGPHFHSWEHNRFHVLTDEEWSCLVGSLCPPSGTQVRPSIPLAGGQNQLGVNSGPATVRTAGTTPVSKPMACDDPQGFGRFLLCEETPEGARVATHCLYPSFESVRVFVARLSDGFNVHDGSGAITRRGFMEEMIR